jgi:hypothetical protein
MTALGLPSSGRLGMSPRDRRSASIPFSLDQISGLAVWYGAGDPQNTVAGGALEQVFDLSGNGRHCMATVGVNSALAPADQLKLIDRAVARWGV